MICVKRVRELKEVIRVRYEQLMTVLEGKAEIFQGEECLRFDSSKVRLAVDDFKTILSEVRRLT